MKYTKLITSLIAAAFVCSSSLMAADDDKKKKGEAAEKAAAKTPIFLQVSDLTEEQTTDIKAALKDHQAVLKAAGKNRGKRAAAGKKFVAKLKEIYSEEQFKQFQAKQKKAQQQRRKGKGKKKK